MFCPPNYARIEELCAVLAKNLITDMARPDDANVTDWLRARISILEKDTWIFLRNCPSLSIASPQGVVLRVGDIALAAVSVSFDGQVAEISTGRFGSFRTNNTDEDFLKISDDVWPSGTPKYLALSPDWIVEDLKQIESKIALFSDLPGDNGVSIDIESVIGKAITAEIFENAKKMAPFAGWSLCVLEADLPKPKEAASLEEPNLAKIILGVADSKKPHMQIKAETLKMRPNLSHKDFDRWFEIARNMQPDKFLKPGRPKRN